MFKGTVRWFNEKKGFGFILDNETKKDIFVHISEVSTGNIKEGDIVSFDIKETKYGKQALKVIKI